MKIASSSPTFPQVQERVLTKLAIDVLAKRYSIRDPHTGELQENPKQVFRRVAKAVAGGNEPLEEDFYHIMAQGWFMPNSPTIMNAGRPLGMLSACFVLPVPDEIEGIYNTLRDQALIHKSGGGTGFSFSNIRPKGDKVFSTTGVASGPISFMDVYNHSTEAIKQGGTRRGANMGILRVDHPDIREFITVKQDLTRVTNFNVSVAITDDFMSALQKGEDYALINPRDKSIHSFESAQEIFDLIVECAWKTAEPGLFFIDAANAQNPVPHLGAYEATNPCGEQPLLAYDVCNLGSINLGAFVIGGEPGYLGGPAIDWAKLQDVIRLAVDFLDRVIDINVYPLPEIHELSHKIRRIGLGVMGWADMLIKLGIPYDSPTALQLANKLGEFFRNSSHDASMRLGRERGVFPEWEKSIWGPDETCARNEEGNRIAPMMELRNCNVTTVAPTGTISMFADCSSGIEPLFAVAMTRNQADMIVQEFNKNFPQLPPEVMDLVARTGHADHDEVPEEIRRVWVTANQVSAEAHVAMQAVWQQFIDSAISKTINMPNEATREDVRRAYLNAYELGCKGITVYRDGCRQNQVLSVGSVKEATPASTPPKLEGTIFSDNQVTRKLEKRTGFGHLRMFVVEFDGKPLEVFLIIGRAGSDTQAFTEGLGRVISVALQRGVGWETIAEQLMGIGGSTVHGFGPNRVASIPDAVGQMLFEAYGQEVVKPVGRDLCPSCGQQSLVFAEGCKKCESCGYSAC